ncbi:MAG: HAD family hydrolase [Actinomycetota bacterium]
MAGVLLPSWRAGTTRSQIIDFFDRVDTIPVDERVAVFDNDGTLWCEKPNYVQAEFLMSELRRAVADDPTVGDRAEYRALLDGDFAALAEIGFPRAALALVELHNGLTPEEYTHRAAAFVAEFRHSERGVPMRQLRYQPMLELIRELRARQFDVFLVSAGGADFVRSISSDFYGVKPEGVVGSEIGYELARRDGAAHLVRASDPADVSANEGADKPSNIQRALGRRPCVAVGNSPGDADMLRYAAGHRGPSLALLVNHDDAAREYAYASVAGTFDADESILDTAAEAGWVVVSMRDDWEIVFADR